MRILCVFNEKYFTNSIETVKDVEPEEESEEVSNSGLRTDNESTTSTF